MKKLTLAVIIYSSLFMVSCSNETKTNPEETTAKEPPRAQYQEQIDKMEKEMHQSKEINPATADLAIKAYMDYAMFFPKDSVTPDYMFKAAEVATAAKKYQQALIYYQNITKDYPNYKMITESLYLQGYLLDNFLNDDNKAKVIYEQVIQKYPSNTLANDAKSAIANLGKTDEELIQEFKKKNGGK